MAVYTDVNENELGAFLKAYPVGELLSYKGIAEGTENSNFLVHASTGSYILTLYEKRVDKADLPFFLGLMGHLARKGISCPLPVTAHDGTVIGTLAGRPAVIITFLEGLSLRRPTAAHCAEVGKALASLHVAGQDFQMRRPNALAIEGWRKLWDASRNRADEVEPGLAAEVDADFGDFERNWPAGLPQGIIHADLFPDNVLMLDDKVTGLIDFYFACTDITAYDVAVAHAAWCFSGDGRTFDRALSSALLDGYEGVRPLGNEERAALPILARGASMRFLASRAYDWLNTPKDALVTPKDPLAFARRLRFYADPDNAPVFAKG